MKNSVIHILLLLVTFVGTCAATSPIKLVSQDACRWGAKSEGEGENKHIVMDKGCPQYYTNFYALFWVLIGRKSHENN